MLRIHRAYGVSDRIMQAIGLMYNVTRARVLTPDGNTDYFEILAAVLQGNTLAPFLIAIVLDYAMGQAIDGKEEKLTFKLDRRRSRQQNPTVITETDFADDNALITEDMNQAQELLTRVEIESCKIGLNYTTLEVIHYNQVNSVPVLAKDGSTIKTVDNFKYLGAWMLSSGKDFLVRKALAWSACHKLRKVWKSNLSEEIKKRLFLTTLELIALYGSETWSVDKTLCKRLDACYTRMLRMAMNIS